VIKRQSFKTGLATRKLLIIIAVGIVLSVGGYAGYRYVKNNLKITRGPTANTERPEWLKTAKEARETMATIAPTAAPDFIANGSLRLFDEGEETEEWALLYQESGKRAATAYLNFNFRSQCDFGGGEQMCHPEKFENGLKVHLEGTKSGSEVTVIKLKVLE
jgi:hypothetical protein